MLCCCRLSCLPSLMTQVRMSRTQLAPLMMATLQTLLDPYLETPSAALVQSLKWTMVCFSLAANHTHHCCAAMCSSTGRHKAVLWSSQQLHCVSLPVSAEYVAYMLAMCRSASTATATPLIMSCMKASLILLLTIIWMLWTRITMH